MKKKICLIGFGNIGKEFLRKFTKTIKDNKNKIFSVICKTNNREYKKTIEKRIKGKIIFETKIKKTLIGKRVKKIVELTNNIKISKYIAYIAIKKNKTMITANKELIACNYNKLKKYIGKNILFESSVFGGTPIIETIENHIKISKIKKVKAIINGTTNYILDNIFRKNKRIKEAIEEARKKGLSEKFPKYDLMGIDTYYKTYIMMKIINKKIKVKKPTIKGINKLNNKAFKTLKKKKIRIKLIGKIKIKKNLFCIEVYPYIDNEEIHNEYNKITIKTKEGKIEIKGKGAGGENTSISAIKNLINRTKKEFEIKEEKKFEMDIIKRKIYILIMGKTTEIKKGKNREIKKENINNKNIVKKILKENNIKTKTIGKTILKTENKLSNKRIKNIRNKIKKKIKIIIIKK